MKISNIKPIDLVNSHKDAEEVDINWFLTNAHNFEVASCPGCGSNKTQVEFKKGVISYLVCENCECNYISPRPNASLLAAFYKDSANYNLSASELFKKTSLSREKFLFEPRYNAFIANFDFDKNKGMLVDVGAGFGGFCELLKKKNFEKVTAIEPNVALANSCAVKGINTICEPYEDVNFDDQVTAIFAFEVIEHLYSPNNFLNWCSKHLQKDGVLFLTTPDISGFETEALGVYSDCFCHEHLNLFTSRGLQELLSEHEFAVQNAWSSGDLDVQIVQRKLKTLSVVPEGLGGFLRNVLASSNSKEIDLLQNYLKKSGRTSHVSVIAKKK